MKHANLSKAEKEYVRALVHNFSLSRWTDQEIVEYLHNEKKIEIARTSVNHIRHQISKQAVELRNSTFKYIATYKERIDSLCSYQKKLHEIIAPTKKPEVRLEQYLRLHSIEMSIFSLWKQLPDLQIVEKAKEQQEQQEQEHVPLVVDDEDINGVEHEPTNPWHDYYQCDSCKRWWSSKS